MRSLVSLTTSKIMSGGHYSCSAWRLEELAEELERDAAGKTDMNLRPASLTLLKITAQRVREVAKMVRYADLMMSGDAGEEEFLKQLAKNTGLSVKAESSHTEITDRGEISRIWEELKELDPMDVSSNFHIVEAEYLHDGLIYTVFWSLQDEAEHISAMYVRPA